MLKAGREKASAGSGGNDEGPEVKGGRLQCKWGRWSDSGYTLKGEPRGPVNWSFLHYKDTK